MTTRKCAVADCIWSGSDNFCTILHRASVPLDEKWPLLILYLRGIKNQLVLTDSQKAKMQDLLLHILQSGDFGDDNYQKMMESMFGIVTMPHDEKLATVTREVVELNKEMERILGRHTRDVMTVTQNMDNSIAKGQDPALILTGMRTALKDVIAKMEEDTRTLKTLSHKDSLTGIANRRFFDDFLDESVNEWQQRQTPVSLIIFDIDHFKNFNDTYGHLVGDNILRTLGSKVQKLVASLPVNEGSGVLFARYGGEEFAVILRGDATEQDAALGERIRDTIQNTNLVLRDAANNVVKNDLRVTVSVGVTRLWPGWKGVMQTNLIDGADKALYHAKQNGRNRSAQYVPETESFRFIDSQ